MNNRINLQKDELDKVYLYDYQHSYEYYMGLMKAKIINKDNMALSKYINDELLRLAKLFRSQRIKKLLREL